MSTLLTLQNRTIIIERKRENFPLLVINLLDQVFATVLTKIDKLITIFYSQQKQSANIKASAVIKQTYSRLYFRP